MRSRRFAFCATLLVLVATSAILIACDTPVYRYALYRWQPSDYLVYHLHSKPQSAEAEELASRVAELSAEDAPERANLFLHAADISDEQTVNTLDPHVKETWEKEGKPADAYFVFAPTGELLHAGAMSTTELKSLTDSPTRRRIGELLTKGHATVLLVLADAENRDEERAKEDDTLTNDQAAARVDKMVKAVAAGQIEFQEPGGLDNLFPGAAASDDETPPAEASKPEKPVHSIATIRIARDDPKEAWLVRALLAVEPDLPGLKEPMVFPIYGRGRALPPLVGPGISDDNLVDVAHFVTGACSCTIKEQNPGVDLLMTYNWEEAAQSVADIFGAEEGNEQLSASDLFPELIIPGSGGDGPDAASGETASLTTADDTPNTTSTEPSNGSSGDPTVASPDAQPSTTERQVASNDSPTARPGATADAEGVQANYSIYAIGGGFALILAMLFAATFLVLRPR
ncbi:MAG: hypothetical protein QGG36_30440 [Pirellulaceae bacterium]|nr:hypothetical protein [Pirellulaceae bacterium]